MQFKRLDFLRAILLVVLTQLPFWLIQSRLSVQRPVFNLDLFVALLILFWRRSWGIAAIVIAWIIEISHDASVSYHFVDPADFIDAVRFLDMVKLGHILSWQLLLGLAAMLLAATALYRIVGRQAPSKIVVFAFGVMCFVADTANGSNHILGIDRDRFIVSENIAGSPSYATLHREVYNWIRRSQPMNRLEDPIVFNRAAAWHAQHPQSSVLLVLVESMGLTQSPAVRDWLASRLDTAAVEQRWKVERTVEYFYGPTVYGEVRVLCGLQGHYSRLKPEEEAQCLPRRFVDSGAHAFGLHGFNLHMFDRYLWWRNLGLEPQPFYANGSGRLPTGCNAAFPGVCDGQVLKRAVDLADEPSRLVYVVTLDTHLPMPTTEAPLPPDLAALCTSEKVNGVACQMVGRLAKVLDALQGELLRMKRPPLVLVVGDHAPPFLQSETRGAFDIKHVPGMVLEPR